MPNITRQIVLLVVQVQRARQNAGNMARKSALCHNNKLSIPHSKGCFASAIEKSIFSRVSCPDYKFWPGSNTTSLWKKPHNFSYPVPRYSTSHTNQLQISINLAWTFNYFKGKFTLFKQFKGHGNNL